MRTTWIFDEGILGRLVYFGRDLPGVVESLGHRAIRCPRHTSGIFDPVTNTQGPVVLYGSHEFIKQVQGPVHQPGALGVNLNTRASAYMSNLPLEWFLNRDATFMTWAMFKHRASDLFQAHGTRGLFIRPDSGFKTFAGQRLRLEDLDLDINTLDQTSGVVAETLVLVNPEVPIQGEFRFVIADQRVVAGSEYRWDGRLDIRRDWPQECWDMAQRVADHEWQVDIAYTCDVALTESGPRVVELNGFSCAGLYACDLEAVVAAVSAAAQREWSSV